MSYWNDINNNECNHSHSCCYDGKCVSEKELVNAKDDIIATTKEYAEGLQEDYKTIVDGELENFETDLTAYGTRITNNENDIADLKIFVTPEMFGAVGDGVTDDTEAFQTMFESANHVFIPNKTYCISTVNVPEKDIVIEGSGTIKVSNNGLKFTAPTSRKVIKGIKVDLSNGEIGLGFYGDSTTTTYNSLIIDGVTVKSAALSGKIGIDLRSENEALFINTSLYGCCLNVINSINPTICNSVFRHSKTGIYNANSSTASGRDAYACGLRLLNTTILGCNIGIKTVQVDSVQIQSSLIDYNDNPIVILGTTSPVIDNCYISSRGGNSVVYIAPNNNESGVFGGNGLNTETTNDVKISNCNVIQHDEALTNSAIVIKSGQGHMLNNVTVSYGGKSCIELHDTTNTTVDTCTLRSSVAGAKAIVSFKQGALDDTSTNIYRNIITSLPIYVRYAQTDISTQSFVTERKGTKIIGASDTSVEIDTGIAQGIDYVLFSPQNVICDVRVTATNGSKFTLNVSGHTSNVRVNWLAVGKNTHTGFTI